jgi:hypothetical protein
MSEPSVSKRVKVSATLGGPDPLALKVAKKNARIRKSLAVNTTLRSTKRAEERWQATDEDNEVETLEFQLNNLQYESDENVLQEFDIIQSRLQRLNEHFKRLAAKEGNKDFEFACSICFDNEKIDALRIVNPCGHGFCNTCLEKHAAPPVAAGADDEDHDGPVCPTCRGAIACG